MNPESKQIAVIGCGVMGVGIAATAIGYGINVALIDVDVNALRTAEGRIEKALRMGSLLGVFPPQCTTGQVEVAGSVNAVCDSSIVIEAVHEDEKSKKSVMRKIQHQVGDTPLITNTSGIPIDSLAESLPHPEQLIGVHFMNPAYLIKVVEVAKGVKTSEATWNATMSLLDSINRKAIVVRDSPGFVTSRLLHSMINDAACLVEQGVASAAEIDELMQGCLGHQTGPLRTADIIGLDNLVDSLDSLFTRTRDIRYSPSRVLRELIAEGKLGQKSGKGFYEYGEV